MRAHWANIGSFFPDDDMAAISALPTPIVVSRKHDAVFDVFKQFSITLFVRLFDCTDSFKEFCDFIETFVFCDFRKFGVHIGPLVVFAVRRGFEIFRRRTDAAVEQLIPYFRVLFFVVRRFFKQRGDLFVSVFARFARKIEILRVRLRFSRKRRFKIFFCL